jgi:hypothetical protein
MGLLPVSQPITPPRVAQFSNTAQYFWTSSGTNVAPFNGFLLVNLLVPTVAPPTMSPGESLTPNYGQIYPGMPLPLFQRIPIINGQYNTTCGLYLNSDIVPPGSGYQWYLYDSASNQVSGPSATFFVTTTNVIDPIAATGGVTIPVGTTPLTATLPDVVGT